jgi:hypothetical protein
MKTLRIATSGTAVALLWCFGAAGVGTAQPGKHNRERQEQAREKEQQKRDRVEQRQDRRQREHAYTVQRRTQRQVQKWQTERGWVRQGGGWQGSDGWSQNRAQQWRSQHRTWAQRGGYGGYYIPRDRFMAQFGSRNVFRINTRPNVVGGFPRFHYGGYQFMMVDPWPESWADDWYANDEVYVDYDDGYYLHNRRDPGFRIAISVVL